jgi:hypothetical protein
MDQRTFILLFFSPQQLSKVLVEGAHYVALGNHEKKIVWYIMVDRRCKYRHPTRSDDAFGLAISPTSFAQDIEFMPKEQLREVCELRHVGELPVVNHCRQSWWILTPTSRRRLSFMVLISNICSAIWETRMLLSFFLCDSCALNDVCCC